MPAARRVRGGVRFGDAALVRFLRLSMKAILARPAARSMHAGRVASVEYRFAIARGGDDIVNYPRIMWITL
jgi:hypothetical protein